jgi:hypothetical protein
MPIGKIRPRAILGPSRETLGPRMTKSWKELYLGFTNT